MYDPKNHSSLLWIDLVPALVPLGSAHWQKREISAHYRELIWFLIWFHLVPHVGRSPESQLTIRNWFGSTWFHKSARARKSQFTFFGVKVRLAQKTLEKFLWFSSWHKTLPFLSQANKSKGAIYSSLIQTGASSTSDLLAWLQKGARKNFTL